MPPQVMGTAHTPHGFPGLGLCKSSISSTTLGDPYTEQTRVKKGQQEAAGPHAVMISFA